MLQTFPGDDHWNLDLGENSVLIPLHTDPIMDVNLESMYGYPSLRDPDESGIDEEVSPEPH